MLMRQLTEAEVDTTGQDMIRRATKVMNRRVLDIAKRIQVFTFYYLHVLFVLYISFCTSFIRSEK